MCLSVDVEKHKAKWWQIFSRNKPVVRKAKEDIVVYKILKKSNGELCSPYRNYFVWDTMTKHAELEYIFWGHGHFAIEDGLHAFSTEEAAMKQFTIFRMNEFRKYAIYKAIIPKGTKYWLGHGDEIASEKMTLVEQLNIKDYE